MDCTIYIYIYISGQRFNYNLTRLQLFEDHSAYFWSGRVLSNNNTSMKPSQTITLNGSLELALLRRALYYCHQGQVQVHWNWTRPWNFLYIRDRYLSIDCASSGKWKSSINYLKIYKIMMHNKITIIGSLLHLLVNVNSRWITTRPSKEKPQAPKQKTLRQWQFSIINDQKDNCVGSVVFIQILQTKEKLRSN